MDEKKERDYNCFISYCDSEHRAAAEALYLMLRLVGLKPWFDGAELYRGDIRDVTRECAGKCRDFIIIYSDGWDKSHPCNDELNRFTAANPGVDPLVVQFGPQVPSIRFRSWLNYELSKPDEWGKLLKALGVNENAAKQLLEMRWSDTGSPLVALSRKADQQAAIIEEKEREIWRLREYLTSDANQRKQSEKELTEIRRMLEGVIVEGRTMRKEDLTPEQQRDIEEAAPAYTAQEREEGELTIMDLAFACIMEHYTRAVEIAEAISTNYSEDADFYSYWGVALGHLGRYEEACEKYAEAVKHRLDFAEAYSNWGDTLRHLDRHEEACEKCAEAVKHKPDLTQAYYIWGYALNELGRREESHEKYDEALKTELLSDIGNLGEWFFYENRFKEAEASLQRAVDTDEYRAQAGPHIILAAALAAQQKRQEALAELQVQEALSVESFKVDKPDAIFAALKSYKDDPAFASLIENVRKKLGIEEGSEEN